MLRLPPSVAARVSSIRYDPSGTFKNAFVEELELYMAKAAERLRPEVAPALSIVLVTDPATPAPGGEVIDLIRKACPKNVEFVPQWVGIHRPNESWNREGVVFLLSAIWRGGLLQGGSLERAYHSLVLSLLATEASRVAPHDFDCFARLRYHSRGKIYRVAIDPIDLPDFDREADRSLRLSAIASYVPEIDARAREAALRIAPAELGPLLHRAGSRASIEPSLAEPLLCGAISRSISIAQASASLGDWAATAAEPVADLLRDLQVALTQWMVEVSSFNTAAADLQLARPLFANGGFPLLHELKMQLTAHRTQLAFRQQSAILRAGLAKQRRAELDRDYYELLPNDLSAAERLAITSGLAKANGSAARVTITRHFPLDMVTDTREEILDLRDLSTVLYALEMHPA